jgi:formamidopyrimidine-DNA glycosylase
MPRMPELPEVEFARQCLERWAGGARVTSVAVHERRVVTGPPLGALVGARFTSFERRGKHLCLGLRQSGRDGKASKASKASKAAKADKSPGQPAGLWSHLGMTGKWLRRAQGELAPRFSRVELGLDSGVHLHYVDMRLFGRLRLVPGAAFDDVPTLKALGPDALDGVDVARLQTRFARSNTPIKVALMDQRVLAGLGNIQVSEALFRARLDPRRPARTLSRAELGRLGRGIRASLDYTLARFAREVGARKGRDIRYVEEPEGPNPFRVYGRAGEPCPRSGDPIVRLVQAGRSTFFCPQCQR